MNVRMTAKGYVGTYAVFEKNDVSTIDDFTPAWDLFLEWAKTRKGGLRDALSTEQISKVGPDFTITACVVPGEWRELRGWWDEFWAERSAA